jgi:hypothetical protein
MRAKPQKMSYRKPPNAKAQRRPGSNPAKGGHSCNDKFADFIQMAMHFLRRE